jgi:hypothetical protein
VRLTGEMESVVDYGGWRKCGRMGPDRVYRMSFVGGCKMSQIPRAFAIVSFNGPFRFPSLVFWMLSRVCTTKNMLDILFSP